MAQILERKIYVMTFGLYFEVPAKKIEISEKKVYIRSRLRSKMVKIGVLEGFRTKYQERIMVS